jgi:hypothetical protein
MSYNGSGTYSPPSPEYPAVSGAVIYASDFNTIISDIATALSSVLVKDGQTAMTGVLNFGGFKGSNLATPVATTDATTKAYVDAADALNLPIIVTADRSMYGYKITNLGTPTLSTDAATKGYIDTYYGALAGATWTGAQNFTGATITVTTQTFGDSSTKAASTAFVAAGLAALPSSIPSLAGHGGQVLKVNVAETLVEWKAGGIAQVTTATTATTLTSTPTLLKITPTSYGVTVTLPDATTCSVGGPLHIIDNRGAYPVRICNSAGTLKAFVFAGVVSHISLDDNSTAAGVWAVENGELVGASAQLQITNGAFLVGTGGCIDLGSGRELLTFVSYGTLNLYSLVYDKVSNTFGAATLLRGGGIFGSIAVCAALVSTDKVLVVSCGNAATNLEAVCLSISGTTITVNTAATATLSANISAFADGCGLIAVGSSFVTSYTVATPAAQIRALSISGTTVTIGSASVLTGTAGGLIVAGDSTHVIATSTATTHLYTTPYLVSGSTLTLGTGTDTNSGTMVLNKLAVLGTRWFIQYIDGAAVYGGVISLTSTGNGTTTISAAAVRGSGSGLADAIVVGSNKVLTLTLDSSSNANILTDTAGTASAGTAITLSSQTTRACLYASGTDVAVAEGTTDTYFRYVDCSGASPVLTLSSQFSTTSGNATSFSSFVSNAILSRSPRGIYAGDYFEMLLANNTYRQKSKGAVSGILVGRVEGTSGAPYRGKAASECWATDAATVITKIEAAL